MTTFHTRAMSSKPAKTASAEPVAKAVWSKLCQRYAISKGQSLKHSVIGETYAWLRSTIEEASANNKHGGDGMEGGACNRAQSSAIARGGWRVGVHRPGRGITGSPPPVLAAAVEEWVARAHRCVPARRAVARAPAPALHRILDARRRDEVPRHTASIGVPRDERIIALIVADRRDVAPGISEGAEIVEPIREVPDHYHPSARAKDERAPIMNAESADR